MQRRVRVQPRSDDLTQLEADSVGPPVTDSVSCQSIANGPSCRGASCILRGTAATKQQARTGGHTSWHNSECSGPDSEAGAPDQDAQGPDDETGAAHRDTAAHRSGRAPDNCCSQSRRRGGESAPVQQR